MAVWYVYSGAAGTASGADWTNAKTTLAAAIAAGAAGDTYYIAHDHAETAAAATTITFKGTVANPDKAICVNRAGSVPPVSADVQTSPAGSITTTGANAITLAGAAYISGLIFNCASGANAANLTFNNGGLLNVVLARDCAFNVPGTSGNSSISWNGGYVEWDNCTVSFGATGSRISPSVSVARFLWKRTSGAIQGATLPTNLILASVAAAQIDLLAVDLSALTSGHNLFQPAGSSLRSTLRDCKLASGVTVVTTPTAMNAEIFLTRCDSGSTNYRNEKYHYAGTLTTETTIVRTGGATDGTTPVSHKIVTTANSKWQIPFECLPISIWNDTTGSTVNVTLYGIWGGGAVPNNDDIWMDVEYLGDASTPMGSFNIGTKANILATGSALASDSSTWGGSTTAFKFTAAITPQQKGPIVAYVRCAKANTTFYIDPLIVLS